MSRKQRRTEKVYTELHIEALGNEGVAIARNEEGIVHFVKHAAPGDHIIAEIRSQKKRYAEGIITSIIKPSEYRISPLCKHAGICGGCSWQHLAYEQQLHWKRQLTIDVFERIGKIPVGEFAQTMPAPLLFNYRNKMEFSFGSSRWLTEEEISSDTEFRKGFALGLHIPGRFDKILDIEECHIQDKKGNSILSAVHAKAIELELSGYNPRNHEGFLRTLLIRTSVAHNQIMAILITQEPTTENEHIFLDWWYTLRTSYPFITSILHYINLSFSPIAQGELQFCDGDSYITEKVLGNEYRISPFSFFQTNSYQLDNFLKAIIDQASIDSNATVWDLYCGAGSITFPAAKLSKKTIGIELSQSSIDDAKSNSMLNNINNVDFYCHDLHKKSAIELLTTLEQPDIIIIDPPRAGVHDILLQHILDISAPKIVYVSCNPSTQARDCAILSEKYEVTTIIPVDMFPQTAHIESIATLILKT